MVTVDYVDRLEPINATVAGPPEAPVFGAQMFDFAGLTHRRRRGCGRRAVPVRARALRPHLAVDFDGSFWVPFGLVDGDASAIINNDSGQMRLLGPNVAEYRNAEGFVASSPASPARSTSGAACSEAAPVLTVAHPLLTVAHPLLTVAHPLLTAAHPLAHRRAINRTRSRSISAQTRAAPGHGAVPVSAAIASAGCAG